MEKLLTTKEIDIFFEIYKEGEQNRFRNNDYRSFEEWMQDKEE